MKNNSVLLSHIECEISSNVGPTHHIKFGAETCATSHINIWTLGSNDSWIPHLCSMCVLAGVCVLAVRPFLCVSQLQGKVFVTSLCLTFSFTDKNIETMIGKIKVKVFCGDITKEKTEAIVSSTNTSLDLSSGKVFISSL